MKEQVHKQGSVRHVEKRRRSTCIFADRIANHSLQYYNQIKSNNDEQTCVATIIAKFDNDDNLQIMAMGIGTKFLNESTLHKEETSRVYGMAVRDCHAEVLAHRAFQQQLCLELSHHLNGNPFTNYKAILQRNKTFELRPNVTLHMYTSSAPCGNATLKKFCKLKREVFDPSLGHNEWPIYMHNKVKPHPGQQYSLLVKKDYHCDLNRLSLPPFPLHNPNETIKPFNATEDDEWCPPGTSISHYNKGSMHTCSDKLCKWNCLGLQGSLVSLFIPKPLYLSTLTVGRKFNEGICRRAICCRATGFSYHDDSVEYSIHHIAIMGTSVLLHQGK